MGSTRFGPDVAAPDVAESLRASGYAIIEGLASEALLSRFEAEIEPYLAATPSGNDDFVGFRTRRPGALIARSPTAREMVGNSLIAETTRAVFAPRPRFQLHLTQVIAIGPDEPAQPLHRDQWAFDYFPFPAGYEAQVNTMWAVTDFTEANGATRIIPGSNHWEDRLKPAPEETIAAEMPRGSVLLYTGALYHGGGANQTQQTRIGANITYCRPWLRQEENQYLACPQDVARTLDEDLLKLMGYSRGAYALGYVDNGLDPLDALLQRAAQPGFAPGLS